jgi:type I restriction enzyme M protein
MITGNLRNQIDKLWEEFWTGGITNPLTVIEQISFLLFSRMLDISETRNEKKAVRLGSQTKAKMLFDVDQQRLRWSNFKNLGGEQMLPLLRDNVFPFFRSLGGKGSTFGEYLKDVQLLIQKPSLLVSAVNMIDRLPLAEGDTKGDLYEYLLSKLTTAGINGQFRTPRHIVRLMVELIDPHPTNKIGDPACGTAGFLVAAYQYLLEKYTSPEAIIAHEDGHKTYQGDQLEPYREHIQRGMFYGFDFDVTMLRIAAMNLMLHDIDTPQIHYQDTLSNSFPDKFPTLASECFDIVLANPPFKGSLDAQDVHSSLIGKIKTQKTELLFLVLMLRMLKVGGRCACIVPDGVLFGTSKAHLSIRKQLIDENQLEAVISLPSGVFRPYAAVSTAILLFTKGGRTEQVFFYNLENDGYSLDDKRAEIDANDLPDLVDRWRMRSPERDNDRRSAAFFVPVGEIRERLYDISFGRYRDAVYIPIEYESPRKVLRKLFDLESEIQDSLKDVEELLN